MNAVAQESAIKTLTTHYIDGAFSNPMAARLWAL
jgi:hypothetical protein